MQIKSYDWFVNREKNRACLVAATAPTILNFPYSKFKGVYITCGDGPIRLRNLFKADYWVTVNDEFPVPEKHLDIINSFKETVFIFSDSVTYSRRLINLEYLQNNLKVKWFAYDQRHFNQRPCKNRISSCCKLLNIYPGRLTIQEYIQKKFNRPDHYSSASTVAIHALAFAILLGCSPIYLQGIEIPVYANEYMHKKDFDADQLQLVKMQIKTLSNWEKIIRPKSWAAFTSSAIKRSLVRLKLIKEKSPFFKDIPQILSDFGYLVDLANENGIEIINLSKTSTLNRIKNLKYLEPSNISQREAEQIKC